MISITRIIDSAGTPSLRDTRRAAGRSARPAAPPINAPATPLAIRADSERGAGRPRRRVPLLDLWLMCTPRD
ncbi:hypothetical protein DFJ69_4261 [Thermomonospora umbrina]|uniref:Uncharacterized protein n=1 Tax=Thermomonospora umbrina TaxID=111806 RepID=A0A3D9T0H2_9ACTN|nr:hypothetical protein DFJ69_4261 [Thermomonospora umbrina]